MKLSRPWKVQCFRWGSIMLRNTLQVNISAEDGLARPDDAKRYRLRAWYPENRLSNGAYEVHFAARDGASSETPEQIAGILASLSPDPAAQGE